MSICGLEDVESKEQALEVELKRIDHFTKLRLSWDLWPLCGDNVEEILEAFHPSPNISVLEECGGMECSCCIESMSLL